MTFFGHNLFPHDSNMNPKVEHSITWPNWPNLWVSRNKTFFLTPAPNSPAPNFIAWSIATNRTGGGFTNISSCVTPNSFVMVNYKTFYLKHYIFFVKICPPNGQITFWPTPLKIEFSKLFYHKHVGCLSRGIEGTCSKITFFSYIALAVLEKG